MRTFYAYRSLSLGVFCCVYCACFLWNEFGTVGQIYNISSFIKQHLWANDHRPFVRRRLCSLRCVLLSMSAFISSNLRLTTPIMSDIISRVSASVSSLAITGGARSSFHRDALSGCLTRMCESRSTRDFNVSKHTGHKNLSWTMGPRPDPTASLCSRRFSCASRSTRFARALTAR